MAQETATVDEAQTDETFRCPQGVVDELEKGDVVEVRYHEQEKADVRGGWKITGTKVAEGTVTKTAGGAVFVSLHRGTTGSVSLKLHDVPGRTVTGTMPYGSRTRRYGVDARIRRTGERGGN